MNPAPLVNTTLPDYAYVSRRHASETGGQVNVGNMATNIMNRWRDLKMGKRRGWKRMRQIGSTQYGELFLDVTNFGEIGLLVFDENKCRDAIWWDNEEQAIEQLLKILKQLGRRRREMAQNLVKFNILISSEKLKGILADLVDSVCELAFCEYVNRTSYVVNIRKKDSESLVGNAARRILAEVIVVKPDEP